MGMEAMKSHFILLDIRPVGMITISGHIKMGNGKEFIWELKYDENGNVVYMKSPDGRISTYEYIEKPFIISE